MDVAARPNRKQDRWRNAILVAASLATSVSAVTTISDKVGEIGCGIYKAFLTIGGALASLIFLIAAIKWIASRDDANARVRQRETMTHALIGIVVLGISKTLVMALAGVTTVPPACT